MYGILWHASVYLKLKGASGLAGPDLGLSGQDFGLQGQDFGL